MAKDEHSTYSTTLDTERIKSIMGSVLTGAVVEPLESGPLDSEAALAILATFKGQGVLNKSPFGGGNAMAQVIVEDRGGSRSVHLVAVAATMGDSWNASRGAANGLDGLARVKALPNVKSSRNLVAALADALKGADPELRSA